MSDGYDDRVKFLEWSLQVRITVLALVALSLLTACGREEPSPAAKSLPDAAPTATPAPSSADEALLESLRIKRVKNLVWSEETRLVDAIGYLRTITGLNFHLTPRAQTETEDVLIPLQVDDVAVADVLNLITSQNGMVWEVRDGLVRMGTAEEFTGSSLLRYYDVNDFVEVEPFGSQPAPAPDTEPSKTWSPPSRSQLLVGTIRILIDPQEWLRKETTLEAKKGVLIVRASRATHEKVQQYLDALRVTVAPPLPPMSNR